MTSNLILFEKYREFFMCYEQINDMQKELVQVSKSLVLSAPAGAGKTFAYDMALVQQMEKKFSNENSNENFKAVYLAPTKSLCAERYADWTERFEREKKLNCIRCALVTGDSLNYNNLGELHNVDVIVTTPEKWEILTHQWTINENILSSIKLFMIDELPILDDIKRGPVIEVIVSRMKTISRQKNTEINFILSTVTVGNVFDITTWIKSGGYKVEEKIFDESYRMVPLKKYVVGITKYKMDDQFNEQILQRIRCAYDKYILVFCNTIKAVESTAKYISENLHDLLSVDKSYMKLLTLTAQSLYNENLKQVLPNRVAFHHASLTAKERQIIEDNFRNRRIRILFATSTLAYGVNLPAQLVIIRGTQYHYGSDEYPGHLITQMIGRAGRKQYESDQGIAVILTHKEDLYNGPSIVPSDIESHLFATKTESDMKSNRESDKELEMLCKEVVLQIINDRITLTEWLCTTYKYVRSPGTEEKLIEHRVEQISQLCNENIFLTASGHKWQGTHLGQLMVKYCLHLGTMRDLIEFKQDATLFEVFEIITGAAEFEDYELKKIEKEALNKIKSTLVRFPIDKNIKTLEDKISCLLQASLGNEEIPHNLLEQAEKVRKTAYRIAKCLFEILRFRIQTAALSPLPLVFTTPTTPTQEVNLYKTLLAVVTMAKCLHAKRWEKQLGNKIKSENTMLQYLIQSEQRNIDLKVLKEEPPCEQLPAYSLQMTFSNDINRETVKVLLVAKQTNERFSDNSDDSTLVLIVGNEENNNIFCFKEICNKELVPYEISFQVPSSVNFIKAHLIHSKLVDVDCEEMLAVKKNNHHIPFENISTIMRTPERKRKTNDTVNKTPKKKNKFANNTDQKQPKLTNFFKIQSSTPLTAGMQISEENPEEDSPEEDSTCVSFDNNENFQKEEEFLPKELTPISTEEPTINCAGTSGLKGIPAKISKSIYKAETSLTSLSQSTPVNKYRLNLERIPNTAIELHSESDAELTKACDEEIKCINSSIRSTIIEETQIESIFSNESPELLTYEEILLKNNLL